MSVENTGGDYQPGGGLAELGARFEDASRFGAIIERLDRLIEIAETASSFGVVLDSPLEPEPPSSIRCALGWHQWRFFVDGLGGSRRRRCKRCGLIQVRLLGAPRNRERWVEEVPDEEW